MCGGCLTEGGFAVVALSQGEDLPATRGSRTPHNENEPSHACPAVSPDRGQHSPETAAWKVLGGRPWEGVGPTLLTEDPWAPKGFKMEAGCFRAALSG